MTNTTLTIGEHTYPVGHVEIRMAVNPPEEDRKEEDKESNGFGAMTYAPQQFRRSAVDVRRILVSSPLLALLPALLRPAQMRRDLYFGGTVWSDPDGRWRMEGYDEELDWFRDLLAFRYGDAVGPVLQEPHPHFELNLVQMYACRSQLWQAVPDPWAETDEACIRRWMYSPENISQDFPKETPPSFL